MQPYEFLPEGFWRKDSPPNARVKRTVDGQIRRDAVVVGGGYTGLSSALALAQQGYSVAVLERGVIGSGASAYNCGHVGIQLGKNPYLTLNKLGLERTRMYADVLTQAIANVGEIVSQSGIDCHYRAIGNLTAGVSEPQRRDVQNTFEACEKVGLPVKMLDRRDLSQMDAPAFVDSAFHELIGGDIQPALYVQALAKLAEDAGVEIYEDCPVTRVNTSGQVRADTANGAVLADMAVIATNAYSGEIGLLRRSIMPWSVSVMVTEQLTPHQRACIGWRNGEPIHTPHQMIENIRLTHDGRILIGTKRARLGWGDRHPPANDPVTFQLLLEVLRDRFPEIPDLRPAYTWSGRVAISSDLLPFFDHFEGRRNVVIAAGYGGHGLPMASYSGTIIADMLLGNNTDRAALFVNRKRRLPIPPEPLRWVVGHAMKRKMVKADSLIDAAARRELSARRALPRIVRTTYAGD